MTQKAEHSLQPIINILDWGIEETCYGTIRHGQNGETVLSEGIFENMEMFLGTLWSSLEKFPVIILII